MLRGNVKNILRAISTAVMFFNFQPIACAEEEVEKNKRNLRELFGIQEAYAMPYDSSTQQATIGRRNSELFNSEFDGQNSEEESRALREKWSDFLGFDLYAPIDWLQGEKKKAEQKYLSFDLKNKKNNPGLIGRVNPGIERVETRIPDLHSIHTDAYLPPKKGQARKIETDFKKRDEEIRFELKYVWQF